MEVEKEEVRRSKGIHISKFRISVSKKWRKRSAF